MNWIDDIRNYSPFNEQEMRDKEVIITAYYTSEDLLTRQNAIAHMTSSGFIVNPCRDKVLMVHHNIYNTWAWTGGHTDGDGDLLAVALREAKEETGVETVKPVTKKIISLDILPVLGHMKKGAYVSAHLHLNVAYLLEVEETQTISIKADENSGVKWIPIEEIADYANEPYVVKVYDKIINRMRQLEDKY